MEEGFGEGFSFDEVKKREKEMKRIGIYRFWNL